MRKLLLYSVLALSGFACNDQLYQRAVAPNNRRTVVRGDTLRTFTITIGETTKTQSEVYYTWYRRNNLATTQGGYEGHLLDGPYTKMLRDNTLLEKGQFHEGLKEGVWTTWHGNGAISDTQQWNQGEQRGTQATYDTQGTLQQSQSFRRGQRHGEEVVYLPYPGSILKTQHIRTWTEGELTGPFTIYDSLDQIYQRGNYRNGQLDGKVTTYERHLSDKGRPMIVEQVRTYQSGQPHGAFVERYPDGHIKRTGSYRNGDLYGKVTTYEVVPSSGVKRKQSYRKRVYSWKGEQYDGPFVEYNTEGKPERKGSYQAGQLHGRVTSWDADREKSVAYYEEGQLVEKQKFSERIKSLKDKLKPDSEETDPQEVTERRSDEQ